MRSTLGYLALMLVIWVLAWGSLSWANVASGLAVALVLLVVIPGTRGPAHVPVVRPLALARLGLRVARDLVVSNIVLTREVVTPGSRISTGVVGVPLEGCSDELVTLVANLLTLTPGTMPIEIGGDPTMLYVHVLHLDRVDDVRRQIRSLRDLVVRAFGGPEAVAALARADDRRGGPS
jgi:multicomponent Na+:H+ antiporter subunit E